MKSMHYRVWAALGLLLALAVLAFPHVTTAGPRAPAGEEIDLFAGIASGQIDVKIIPRDSTQARVLITNNTQQPLSVKLPDAFGAVPALGQQAPRGAGAGGGGGAQAMGGGMGGGGGGGMGMMNVAPEKVGQLKTPLVCLEHGKPDPRASIPYEIKPLADVTAKPEVQELCRELGTGKVPQRVAQIAAWHWNNNMSWQELAAKQYRYANGGGEPYFTMQEMQAAMRLATVIEKRVQDQQQRDQQASPGATASAANAPAAN